MRRYPPWLWPSRRIPHEASLIATKTISEICPSGRNWSSTSLFILANFRDLFASRKSSVVAALIFTAKEGRCCTLQCHDALGQW